MQRQRIFIIGDKIVKLLKSKQLVCFDKTHQHRSPVQKMTAMEINGHYVEVTQDGDRFNARIDEKITRRDLTVDQAVGFVEDNTP